MVFVRCKENARRDITEKYVRGKKETSKRKEGYEREGSEEVKRGA